VRVYLPATSSALRVLSEAGQLGEDGMTGFAVTGGLRSWYVDDDLEELEYAAARQAARASIRLIDADPGAARRRVVVSVDVADTDVTVCDDLELGAVRVAGPVRLGSVVALHADDAEAEAAVAAAAAVVVEADLGLESAQDRLDDAEGYELAWYARQELPELLAELSRA
jgi:hypothetical protein